MKDKKTKQKKTKKKQTGSGIKKFKRRKVHSSFKDNIWDVYLAHMQLKSRYKKGIKYLLCIIDVFSKYAWVVPLKDEKGVSIVYGFQKIFRYFNNKTK